MMRHRFLVRPLLALALLLSGTVASAGDVSPPSVSARSTAFPWLGVSMDNGGDTGVQIEHVVRGSPAERGGLRSGDRIVAIDGARVTAPAQVTRSVATHKVGIAVVAVAVLTAMNLRGLRESGTAFAIPTYGFMIVIIGMILTGLVRIFVLGDELRAPSAGLEIKAEHTVTGFALAFLLLRTFSSGCAALTGVEAISNGVPAFKPPKSRNAAATMRSTSPSTSTRTTRTSCGVAPPILRTRTMNATMLTMPTETNGSIF